MKKAHKITIWLLAGLLSAFSILGACLKAERINLDPNFKGGVSGWIYLLVLELLKSQARLIVAVGNSGTVLTSTDGINWSAASAPPPASVNLNAVVYTGSRFVAVGQNTAASPVPLEAVYYSADGQNWSASSISSICSGGMYANTLYDIAAGSGRLVTVGYTSGLAPCVHYSTDDGGTWATGTGVTPYPNIKIAYNGSYFITGTPTGYSSDVRTYRSTDGTSFSATPSPYPLGTKTGVETDLGAIFTIPGTSRVIVAGKYVNIPTNDTESVSSTDSGSSWLLNTTAVFGANTASQLPRSLAYNGSRLVAVGDGCRVDYTSDIAGLTWTGSNNYITGVACGINWKGVAWDGSKFIAVGTSGKVAYSPTGNATDWTIVTPATAQLNGIAVR